ncbi:MAG TPA: SapC family protein [Caulobacteraceae bacterium]|nr:SapC family protein [Caulobacteraceae bacterium]
MSMTTALPPGQLTGSVLFYSQPEPLNRETHGNLGLKRLDKPFAFAATTQVVPLTVGEFPLAALSFPIIFAGEQHQPLAVMGLNANENMFVNDGGFESGVYVPAYIRRYPFVLANDPQREQLVVCIDRAAPMLGELPDLAFFDDKGEPTEYTKGCIQFCQDFETEVRRTESFCNLLRELDLFETRKATHTPVLPGGGQGEPQTIAEYFAVSEAKMKALPDAKIRELLDNGALAQIYAHLTSLIGWDRLIALAIVRQNRPPPPANLN